MDNTWTDNEISKLIEIYNIKEKDLILQEFKGRKWENTVSKARKLNISNRKNKFPKKRIWNEYVFEEEVVKILVTNPTLGLIEVIVDKDDFDLVKKYKWTYKKDKSCNLGYIRTSYVDKNGKNKEILIHRLISKPKFGEVVDHINNNTFDNRKENLQNTTVSKNNQNKRYIKKNNTGIKGVTKYFNRFYNKYMYLAIVSYMKKDVFKKYYEFSQEGLNQANIDIKYARAYIHKNSQEAREIGYNEIPNNIREHIEERIKRNKKETYTTPKTIKTNNKNICWSNKIMLRDNFTCKCCNKNAYDENIKLNAHHILKFSDYYDERYNNLNGITLCDECHKYTHSKKDEIINYLLYFVRNEEKCLGLI